MWFVMGTWQVISFFYSKVIFYHVWLRSLPITMLGDEDDDEEDESIIIIFFKKNKNFGGIIIR